MSGRRTAALLLALAATGIAAAAALAASRSAPAEPRRVGDPAVFVTRLVTQIVRDDYARAWLTLHPAHKAVAPRWTYVDCELMSPIPGEIVALEIARVVGERVDVPGVGVVRGKAVSFRLVLRDPVLDHDVEVEHTAHVVPVDRGWRWVLKPDRYELYRARACGARGPAA